MDKCIPEHEEALAGESSGSARRARSRGTGLFDAPDAQENMALAWLHEQREGAKAKGLLDEIEAWSSKSTQTERRALAKKQGIRITRTDQQSDERLLPVARRHFVHAVAQYRGRTRALGGMIVGRAALKSVEHAAASSSEVEQLCNEK